MAALMTTLATTANVVTTTKGVYSLFDRAHESSSAISYKRGIDNLSIGMEKLDSVREIIDQSEALDLRRTHDRLQVIGRDVDEKLTSARRKGLGVKNVFRNRAIKKEARKFEAETVEWSTKAKRSSACARSRRLGQGPEDHLPSPETEQNETQQVQMPPSYAESSHSDDHQLETAPPSVQQEQDLGLASLSTYNTEQLEANPWQNHKQHAF
ncbi:unnamed protein product [Somion occarium]|uniref:Fungal N-terminal domain-containing protein n=1 Tax=Somion occarium TaxID=3059160 RepID=A0ABP1DGQ6_9APHY